MDKNIPKQVKNRAKYALFIFCIGLLAAFLVAWALTDSIRTGLGVMFLYLAIDFMTPWPDVDKLIIIPLIWMPIIMGLGITQNKVKAYCIGMIISFSCGLLFLLLAIAVLGTDAIHEFVNIFLLSTEHAFTTILGILITILSLILIILLLYYLSRNGDKKHAKRKAKSSSS
jgi:hypothetical protein